MPDVVFVVAGDPSRQTGGFFYNRQMIDGLERLAGISAHQLDITASHKGELAAHIRESRVVLIDSIAFSHSRAIDLAGSILEDRRKARPLVGAIMHMLPSELAESGDPSSIAESERELLPRAELVITVSEYLARRVHQSGAAKDQIFVIPPGRDGASLFKQKDSTDPHGSTLDQRFVCVANWSPAKGIELLLEAFARSGVSASLDLVGSADDESYGKKINELIAEFRLGSRVRISPGLTPDKLGIIYSQAYAFLLASRSEGYPTVLAESLNASVPVIAFAIEPVVELVRDAGVLVPPFDVEAFAAAIRWLSGNRLMRDELARAAGERALELPTWEQSVSRFVELVGTAADPG